MSTPSIATPAVGLRTRWADEADRYAGIKQYSLAQIFAVWAAAAVPMGVLAWMVAPALEDSFTGTGNVPLVESLLLVLTAGSIWQFALVVGLVWFEQRSLRWPTFRNALWLRSPRPAERPYWRQGLDDRDPADCVIRVRSNAAGSWRAGKA